MKGKEPVSNSQAGWLVFLSVVATTTVIILAGAELPSAKRLWSEPAAGWASAVGTFAAALVALWLASRERREREAERTNGAKILADAICDELRAVHWCLASMQAINTQQQFEPAQWRQLHNALQGLVTPVLDRVHGDLSNFDTTTAATAMRAYGDVLRFAKRWKAAKLPVQCNVHTGYPFLATIRKAQEGAPDVQRRVKEAVFAVWPMTSWPDRHPFDE